MILLYFLSKESSGDMLEVKFPVYALTHISLERVGDFENQRALTAFWNGKVSGLVVQKASKTVMTAYGDADRSFTCDGREVNRASRPFQLLTRADGFGYISSCVCITDTGSPEANMVRLPQCKCARPRCCECLACSR